MTSIVTRNRLVAALLALSAATGLMAPLAHADGPPSSNGVISNPTLTANSNIAKAQAVDAITTFMGHGSQECDANGLNCHSAFGADDTLDYNGMQANAQSTSGVQAFSFTGTDGSASSVSAQTGTLAIACGDTATHLLAGVAVKFSSCQVNTNGDTQITFKVCTAPSRNLPVTPPDQL